MAISLCFPLCIPPEPVTYAQARYANMTNFISAREDAMVRFVPKHAHADFHKRTQIYASLIMSGMLVYGTKGPRGSTPMWLWG
jgi:hypothetical protein